MPPEAWVKVELDPAHNLLVNLNAGGQAVPSARFMGGRGYEVIRAGSEAWPSDNDRAKAVSDEAMIPPAVAAVSGP